MSTHTTETSGRQGDEGGTETAARSAPGRVARAVANRGREGTLLGLAGAALLARGALRARRRPGRGTMQALVGAALLGLGVKRRRSAEGGSTQVGSTDDGTGGRSSDADDGDGKAVSDDAHAATVRSDVLHQAEENPRGTSGEPEVETGTDPEGGAVEFTDEQGGEPRSRPGLDDPGAEDPRRPDGPDGGIEIELSEAAMADEASEATGPDPEQAQPTSTEGTEPEPTPAEDASHGEGDVPNGGSDDEAEGDGREG